MPGRIDLTVAVAQAVARSHQARLAYESTITAAARWGITPRRVRVVCRQGRVPGAMHVGRDWLLPAGCEKPGDQRRRSAVQEIDTGGNEHQKKNAEAA